MQGCCDSVRASVCAFKRATHARLSAACNVHHRCCAVLCCQSRARRTFLWWWSYELKCSSSSMAVWYCLLQVCTGRGRDGAGHTHMPQQRVSAQQGGAGPQAGRVLADAADRGLSAQAPSCSPCCPVRPPSTRAQPAT
jgi:hypothetical protein